jgi:hypothetical protein
MGERREVYVALLDEGTAVCRPVAAEPAGPGLFRLVGPVPDGEVWEFPPGAVVWCESRQLSGGAVLVAIERGEAGSSPAADRGGMERFRDS